MAEVFGIVSGVLGLLPLCRDGLGMIKDVFDAPKTLIQQVGRIELQRDRFDQWRGIWRSDDGVADERFKDFAQDRPDEARRVMRQLSLLSQTLFDARALEKQYGIVLKKSSRDADTQAKDLSRYKLNDGQSLTPETTKDFLAHCHTNMSFIKRCRFTFGSKEALWERLIQLLREYNENLSCYGFRYDIAKLLKADYEILLKKHVDDLKRLAEASAYEARHSPPNNKSQKRYKDLSAAAHFKAVVEYEKPDKPLMFSMHDFRLDQAYILTSSSSSTMALLFDFPTRKQRRVVLIEWVDDIDRDQERDVRTKTTMLAAKKPGQLLLPTCYGLVKDPNNRRFGLVLAPPEHIRSNLPTISPPGSISQSRMPVSLKELLDWKHPSSSYKLDLGVRFKLAKKLIDAVHTMHCVGWVHKNIRSNSIIFFPTLSKKSDQRSPGFGFPQPLDYDEPLFVGLFNARADDVQDDPGVYYDSRVTRRPADINLDYYQHPDKRKDPRLRYQRAHDIYSLGCVLLELGLWKPLDRLVRVENDDYESTKRGFQALATELDGLVGSRYGNIVRRCLAISTSVRNELNVKELSDFLSDIAASLDRCYA